MRDDRFKTLRQQERDPVAVSNAHRPQATCDRVGLPRQFTKTQRSRLRGNALRARIGAEIIRGDAVWLSCRPSVRDSDAYVERRQEFPSGSLG